MRIAFLAIFGLALVAADDAGSSVPKLADPLTLYHDFGAHGDCSADDGPPIQHMLDAFVATGRGMDARIPDKTPAGQAAIYCVNSTVFENFAGCTAVGCSSEGVWHINATGATILPRVGTAPPGTDNVAFRFQNAQLLVLDGWQAFGQYPGQGGDMPVADVVVQFEGCNVVVRDSYWAGFDIATDTSRAFGFQSNRGVLTFIDSNAEIDNLQGAASGGSGSAFLTFRNWSDVSVRNVRYTDFYEKGGITYATAAPSAFAQFADVNSGTALSQRALDLSDWTVDEGAGMALLVNPTNAPAHFVNIQRFNVNVSATTGSFPLEIVNAKTVTARDIYLYRGGLDSFVALGSSIETITLEDWFLDGQIATAPVSLDSTVGLFRVRNVGGVTTSGARQTVVLQ